MLNDFARELRNVLPDVCSDQYFKKLNQQVEIFRDNWGIPHIRADNESDAFFAQGFVTAQDRLWHMDFDRHRALGRSSELLGEESLKEDRLIMKMGVEEASKADFQIISTQAKNMIECYTAGVNSFIDSTANLPIEYKLLSIKPEAWEPWHCFAVYKIRNMLMGTFEMKLLKTQMYKYLDKDVFEKLWRHVPNDSLLTVPPGHTTEGIFESDISTLSESVELINYLNETDVGSNAWVISGEKTKSGLPLVAGDSHRALDTPSVYYQIHMSCREFSVSGYSVPGFPGAPHFSHTSNVAFGMTHGNADYQDLYLDKLKSENENIKFLFEDSWLDAQVTTKTINVKNGPIETVQVIKTKNGHVISDSIDSGYGLTFSHTGTNSGTKWAECVYSILHATNSKGLVDSLREWTEPVNNFVYADTHGDFGYKLRGKIPIRHSANHLGIVRGWDEKYEWQGLVPYGDMPKSENPVTGFVVTCNQRVVSPDYPYYIGQDFSPEYRATRIISKINNLNEGTADVLDMSEIHADRVSIPAKILFSKLKSMKLFDVLSDNLQSVLSSWDYRMSPDSVAATIYADIKDDLLKEVVAITVGDAFYNNVLPKNSRSKRTTLNQIFYRVVNQLKGEGNFLTPQKLRMILSKIIHNALNKYDSLDSIALADLVWGKVHKTNPIHPLSKLFPEYSEYLNPPSVSFGGDSDTPQQGGYIENLEVNSISVNRYVHDVSDWNNSRWIVPLGSSGNPGSKHYSDQTQMWADLETIPQLWDWDTIQQSCESRQLLIPYPKK